MRPGWRIFMLAGMIGLACALGGAAGASESPSGFGAPPKPGALAAFDGGLSDLDAETYRRIFALQKAGDFTAADALFDRLEDDILIGTVMAQRHLHPRGSQAEDGILQWLADYPDHPDAAAIRNLAKSRLKVALPTSGDAEPLRGAGGFWAARSALQARHPQTVTQWLSLSAEHSRTFYGLISRRALGLPLGFGWDAETISTDDRDTLAQLPGGRRAMALIQAGEPDRAEAELRLLFPSVDPPTQQAIVAVADAGGLAGLSIRLSAEMQRREGVIYDNARYPVPGWVPADGWKMDRALIYAFARQESGFDPNAKSRAGARGLMQLMPATARFISAGQVRNKDSLFDPATNLALGQRYLDHLLAEPAVGGNLFFLAVAYNGGPGNLAAWSRKAKAGDDPLLFIESLACRESRRFIERIMANLWIYRLRLNQATPSLDAVVAGDWPVYAPQDRQEARIALRLQEF